MERSVKKTLQDIIDAIDEINTFFETREKRFDVTFLMYV